MSLTTPNFPSPSIPLSPCSAPERRRPEKRESYLLRKEDGQRSGRKRRRPRTLRVPIIRNDDNYIVEGAEGPEGEEEGDEWMLGGRRREKEAEITPDEGKEGDEGPR